MDQAQVSLPENIMDEATDQPPREYKSEVLDAFKKASSPSGATVSHL